MAFLREASMFPEIMVTWWGQKAILLPVSKGRQLEPHWSIRLGLVGSKSLHEYLLHQTPSLAMQTVPGALKTELGQAVSTGRPVLPRCSNAGSSEEGQPNLEAKASELTASDERRKPVARKLCSDFRLTQQYLLAVVMAHGIDGEVNRLEI